MTAALDFSLILVAVALNERVSIQMVKNQRDGAHDYIWMTATSN